MRTTLELLSRPDLRHGNLCWRISPTLAVCFALVFFGWEPSCASAAQPPAIPSRTWNSRGLGALIEGSCTGIDGDYVKVVVRDVERRIPWELFHREDLETIRAHFSSKTPLPEQATSDPTPRAECKMLHTIRGGVLPEAKVIGHEGNTIFLAAPDGLKYRVPFELLAEGVRGAVRDAVTRLDGKPFTPEDEWSKPQKPAAGKPTAAASSPPRKPPMPATRPPANQVATPSLPRPTPTAPSSPSTPTTPSVPTSPSAPTSPGGSPSASKSELKPLGEERAWTMKGGKIAWQGRFLELTPPTVRILLTDGQTRQVPFELLEERDRQYAEALAQNGKPGEIPAGAWPLASPTAKLVSLSEGQPVFIQDGKKLVPLDSSGAPLEKRIVDLADEYRLLRWQGEYWVAATDKELHQLDRARLQSKKKIELWKYKRINDIAPHPTRNNCYVSVEQVADHVRKNPAEDQRIVVVDWATGKIHEPNEAYGMWLRMHPSGDFLLAGFHSSYRAGPAQEFDVTGRLVPRLNVEHVDVLNRFRMDGFQLAVAEQFENAGANGQGVVLTADGSRVCYLSFTGYPTYSYQVTSFRTTDFQQKPVTFAMKDRCDCKRIVFNAAGTLAASPTKGGAVVFDATTGKEVEGAVVADPDLAGAAIYDLAFTRDGQRLIFVASRAGSPLFARTVPLNSVSAR